MNAILAASGHFLRCFRHEFTVYGAFVNMPKRGAKKDSEHAQASGGGVEALTRNKDGSLSLRILAKPGAKMNAVTGVTEDGYGVQIAAPPTDGEANQELVKYLAKLLDVRKSDLTLQRGMKSRNKVIQISGDVVDVDKIRDFLQTAILNN